MYCQSSQCVFRWPLLRWCFHSRWSILDVHTSCTSSTFNVMDPLQLWEEFRKRLCEDYIYLGLPVEWAYLGLADINFLFHWHGFILRNFNFPEQRVFVHPEVDVQQNFLLTFFVFNFLFPSFYVVGHNNLLPSIRMVLHAWYTLLYNNALMNQLFTCFMSWMNRMLRALSN